MPTWAEELRKHTHNYVRRGGKQNRKKQVSLIINFLEFTASQEKFISIHELGRRHVINFWKSHRDLHEKTAYDYWLGICKLWEWIGKTEKPPKPRVSINNHKEIPNEKMEFLTFREAMLFAIKGKNLCESELAVLSKYQLIFGEIGIDSNKGELFLAVDEVARALDIRFLVG